VERIVQRAGGLDVHKDVIVAEVHLPGGVVEAGRFATTTQGLLVLRDWLVAFGVTRVGIESTGVYWKAPYYVLEDAMEVWLLNARHMRNIPGRKTDTSDASWICQLIEFGLVRPSFVPPKPIRELRNLTRYRKAQIEERTRETQRLDKILQDAPLTELSSRSFVSERRVAGCVVTVRPRDWDRGCTTGFGVAGRAAVRLGGGDW
jgi:transposase